QVRGEQSAELMDRRMQCLDGRLADMGGLVATFAAHATPAVVDSAIRATLNLPTVDACADAAALLAAVAPPADPTLRARAEALRADAALASALAATGQVPPA